MNNSREKETIITIMVGFMLLYGIFSVSAFWLTALVIGLAAIISDKLTLWIHKAWFLLADILGYVMSRIVLGTLFFVVLLPVALMAKIFRKDMLMMKKGYSSYFIERHIEYQRKDLEKPW